MRASTGTAFPEQQPQPSERSSFKGNKVLSLELDYQQEQILDTSNKLTQLAEGEGFDPPKLLTAFSGLQVL
jgi:hypothetical protein